MCLSPVSHRGKVLTGTGHHAMKSEFARTVTILPGQIDTGGHLGVPDTFELFMDTAALAAEKLGAGWGALGARGVFWITVKTMIRFLALPRFLDTVEVSAQLEAPEARRCRTHYRISKGGETLVLGKTEWALVDVGAGRQLAVADVLPRDIAFSADLPFPAPFPRIDTAFSEPPFALHRVTARDIDMARHMNNVAYVRAIVDAYPLRVWENMRVREMAVVFLASATEDEELRLQRRVRGPETDMLISGADGRKVALARLILEQP